VVSFVDQMNQASTAGWSVTVSGLGFGSLEATPTATVGASHCMTAAWASSTSAVCFVSPGEGVGKYGFATVSGVVGTRSRAFSYDGARGARCGGLFFILRHAIVSGIPLCEWGIGRAHV
jgi:hypothetical protein